jgi:hypothetical protein
MAKAPGKEQVPLKILLSQRDSETLKKFVAQEGSRQSGVISEAIDALREKRAYAAKRSIERPALPSRESPIEESSANLRARKYVPNQLAKRPNVTTSINPTMKKWIDQAAKQGGLTQAQMFRRLIEDAVDPDVVKRKTEVYFFSTLLITAFQEALDYDPRRHHNEPPPALRLEDEDYLKEIRTLIGELRRLNENLENAANAETKPKPKRTIAPRKAAEKSAIQVTKHVNTFLSKYASALGTGAAVLTFGTAGALLHQLGVPIGDLITKYARH